VVTGHGKQPRGQAAAAATSPGRDEAIYDRHAARLYRQALLTLGDAGLAEQVVSDVITVECLRSPPQDDDGAPYRLGVSVRRRCHELAGDPAWWNQLSDPLEGMPGCVAPGGLTVRERAALALVIFGHVGYIEAAGELAISPADMAALLLAVLCKLSAVDMPV
jgi:hypothetical protein